MLYDSICMKHPEEEIKRERGLILPEAQVEWDGVGQEWE